MSNSSQLLFSLCIWLATIIYYYNMHTGNWDQIVLVHHQFLQKNIGKYLHIFQLSNIERLKIEYIRNP